MKQAALIAVFITLFGCANRIAPTGGPKDEDPPVMLRSMPEDGQRNYQDLNVEIEFNEFIKLNGLKEQLIITPRIDSEYDYKFKKKSVYLEFEKPFADSTTYTLNFREGVVDITESQPAQNLQIAFSTGNLLDTLEIYGSVRNMFTHETIKDATVGLYPLDDTLDIFTGPPYYFAKTDELGHYHFRNIKDGSYKIYAFKDDNKNLTCQSASEAYAFLSTPIDLDTTVYADTLYMEPLNIDTLELSRVRPSGRYFNVLANKYLTDAQLEASNNKKLYYHFNEDHDGLIVYNTFEIKDSLAVYTTLQDSLRQITQDTFYLKFPPTERRPNEFKASLENLQASLETKLISGEINITKPIRKIHLDSINIYYDSLTRFVLDDNFNYHIDTLRNKLTFTINTPQQILDSISARRNPELTQQTTSRRSGARSANYKLIFPIGSFISIEQDTAEILQKEIIFDDPSKTGVITGSISTAYPSYTIQLLDNKFQMVKETTARGQYKFANVKPGEYYIRILIDVNENGRWDHSDIRINREAEPVIIYRDEAGNNKTAVRANWEITVDLNF